MKRKGNLYEIMISDNNITKAIQNVNDSHRWNKGHKINRVVAWVEKDIPARVIELREIIENGFVPSECEVRTIYDTTSEKYRDICKPKLYPDQYIHHILIQTIKDPIMRRMDAWACGSIPGRGTHRGIKAIKRWMRNPNKTRYCAELDIRHFYQNIKTDLIIQCLLKVIKDRKVITLAEQILSQGVPIGFYTSQWFANLVLQDLDKLIRAKSARYVRYMDNITIFHSNKRKLKRLVAEVDQWLKEHDLQLKSNWQIFNCDKRLPQALGYRYGRGYTLLRKRNLFRLKKQVSRIYKRVCKFQRPTLHQSSGALSRIGQLKWCNDYNIRNKYIKKGTMKKLKNVVRKEQRKQREKWKL